MRSTVGFTVGLREQVENDFSENGKYNVIISELNRKYPWGEIGFQCFEPYALVINVYKELFVMNIKSGTCVAYLVATAAFGIDNVWAMSAIQDEVCMAPGHVDMKN